MGGNAFKHLLPNASFPRMPSPLYYSLKAQLLPIVQSFYAHATVPVEYPDKPDHGDFDFVVTGPREGLQHEEVKAALRARCSIPQEGSRISNFAVPLSSFATESGLHEDPDALFQVDVNVCEDHEQWKRTSLFQSYGDLGFFIGLFARTAGLSFGIHGLKLADPLPTSPPQTYHLSSSYSDILSFLGLSLSDYSLGFATQDALFAWLARSPCAHVLVIRYHSPDYSPTRKDGVDERPLRRAFVRYFQTCTLPPIASDDSTAAVLAWGDRDAKLRVALAHFGKTEEHAALLLAGRAQLRARTILNGTNVQQWTGVLGMPVRYIMDEIKERLDAQTNGPSVEGVAGWQRALLEMSDEEVRALVVKVKEELDEAGRLEFDWRAAKAAKEERKRLKALAESQEPTAAEPTGTNGM